VATNSEFAVVMKRHHLVCFQSLQHHPQQQQYPDADAHHGLEEARESCCSELYHSGFLTEHHNRKYCLDRIAVVPPTTMSANSIFGNAVVGGAKLNTSDNLVPAFYLSWDDEKETESDLLTEAVGGNSHYKQRRQLKSHNEEGGESILDGGVMKSFSPFHLTDFISSAVSRSNLVIYPLWGYVEGSVSNEGGMHRSYHQSVHLNLDLPRSNDDAPLGRHDSKMNINATVFLPISESVFIDADDPLHVAYEDDTPDGVLCRISIGKSMVITTSRCSIQFVSPETIDIEQPAFASRQYIVAYEFSAELDLLVPNEILENELEIIIEYGTTLHTRYPPLISSDVDQAGRHGVVPIVIQKPVLYSAYMRLNDYDKGTNQHYLLQTDPSAFNEAASLSRDVIIIHVAAGLDDDHAWVTIVTLSLALLGGFVLMRSLDSISIWC
jgi:hypothetical protein